MKAIWICANAKKLIEDRKEVIGYVHSIFSRTCNIITEDNLLISLISNQIPNGPRSISFNLSEDQDLCSSQLKKDMKAVINHQSINVGMNVLKIDLSQSKVWNPNPILDFKGLSEQSVLENIEYLKEALLKNGNFNGIAPIFLNISQHVKHSNEETERIQTNHYCTFIYAKIQKFIDLLMEESVEDIGMMAKQIIGFGPGLTPSTDDFLAGLMIAMLYSRKYYNLSLGVAYQINKAIVDGSGNRTTKVSSEMLLFASKGQVAEHIRNLMVSIFSEKDRKKMLQNISAVIHTGGTSGSDLLAGVYIGFILTLHNRKERKTLKCI